MTASGTSEEHTADLWALADLCTPWCLHVVATLGIAERVAAGVTDVGDLAIAAGCDADALHNVLGHLVGKGVFEEPAPGRFTLNRAAEGLLEPAQKLGLDLDGIGGRFAHAWSTLPTYVRTGASGYAELFGVPFWEDLDAHPHISAGFDALIGPAGHGIPDADLPLTGGWESVRTVVDVGGGTGAMLAELLRAQPHLRGTLIDLPRTVARAAQTFAAAGVAARVSAVGQSFFDPLPAGADVYLLRGVVNDWPDREATAILRRCAEAAGAARVLVVKGVHPAETPRGVSIEMVLLGGKQRSLEEFAELGRRAGLEVVAAAEQLRSGSFVVECRRILPVG